MTVRTLYIVLSKDSSRLIASKINIFFCIIYMRVLCIFIMYRKIHTHTCIYFRKICYVYIFNIFIYNINYMNINIYM